MTDAIFILGPWAAGIVLILLLAALLVALAGVMDRG